MIYNQNGIKLNKSHTRFVLEDINDIKNSMNEIISLMEYETHAKINKGYEFYTNNDDASYKAHKLAPDRAVLNNDIFTSRQKNNMGNFDKIMHDKVLQSENICREYEMWASCDFDNIVKKYMTFRDENDRGVVIGKTVEESEFTGPEYNASVIYVNLVSNGFNERDVRKYILQEYYDVSDNPDHIKKFLHLRLNYNKKMINLYKKMLTLNYEVLNLTKQQAEDMSKNIDIDQVKQLILQNKSKFIKRNGRFYDLRELGFGVAFIQNGKTNLEANHSLEHMLPYLIRYDVTFLTHGKYNSMNITNIFNKEFRKEVVEWVKYIFKYGYYQGQLHSLQDMYKDDDSIIHRIEIESVSKKLKELELSMKDKYDYGEDAMFGPLRENSKWTCMPIKTESAGPFTSVDKLIKQCIKEARQNKQNYNMIKSNNKNVHIMVMCCNPGAIPIDKSISSQKDVHIHYAKASVTPEASNIDTCANDIYLCEQNLKQFCSDVGIDYNNDEYLNECYNSVTDEDIEMLSEMSIKELWDSAVNLAKKIWAAIVAAFKAIINFFKDLIQKIKLAIKDKDADVQDVSYITMESARVKHSKNITLGKAEYEIERACTSISRSITRLEQQQTKIMKQINDDLVRKSKTI